MTTLSPFRWWLIQSIHGPFEVSARSREMAEELLALWLSGRPFEVSWLRRPVKL